MRFSINTQSRLTHTTTVEGASFRFLEPRVCRSRCWRWHVSAKQRCAAWLLGKVVICQKSMTMITRLATHNFGIQSTSKQIGQVPSSDFPPFQCALKGHQTLNEITAVIARILLRHFIWVQHSFCRARQMHDLGTKWKMRKARRTCDLGKKRGKTHKSVCALAETCGPVHVSNGFYLLCDQGKAKMEDPVPRTMTAGLFFGAAVHDSRHPFMN